MRPDLSGCFEGTRRSDGIGNGEGTALRGEPCTVHRQPHDKLMRRATQHVIDQDNIKGGERLEDNAKSLGGGVSVYGDCMGGMQKLR